MKKIICQICAVCLLSAILCMTGCGFFGDETLQIEDVVCTTLGDGSIRMTITYVDDIKEPDVYTIPKGNTGDDGPTGNGIENITAEHDDEKKQTVLTITYTDKANYPDQTMVVPDGISIVGIDHADDPITGGIVLNFRSSNEEICQFEPITIPKGEKGDTGNGIDVGNSYIKDYEIKDDEDKVIENGKEYVFTFTDGSTQSIKIPNPNGIRDITSEENGDSYILTITYTTGEVINIPFNRPADPNKWYYGGNVNDLTPLFGKDGDFFFDTAHQEIWLKEGVSWNKIVSFGSTYTVEFDLNDNDMDPDNKASMPVGASNRYNITAGAYFVANGYDIPIPTRAGYVFKGWYTKKTVNTITMSPFTDLTPVSSDLRLYALWEPVVTP